MKILFLAPQPFYQDRGTPIAIKMVLQVLSQRNYEVDVITYPEGKDISYDNLNIYRTPALPFLTGIRPGFSWKKLVCDGFMLIQALQYASRHSYQMVHAVEEAVFIALLLKIFFKVPYIYDMDSSLSQQMIEKHSFLLGMQPVFNFLEGIAVKNATVILPVCQELAQDIQTRYGAVKVVLMPDVSLV
jgi:hypothetical protein